MTGLLKLVIVESRCFIAYLCDCLHHAIIFYLRLGVGWGSCLAQNEGQG